MDRAKVLLGTILVCTFGCRGGQNNANDQTQNHYALTVEDQVFVDFDNSDTIVDLDLIDNSPAINAGNNPREYLSYRKFPLFDFDVDIDGNMMNSDGIWDIGACCC